MYILNDIVKIRVLSELATGAVDASATAIDSVAIQSMSYSPAYVEGVQQVQRGGGDIVAVLKKKISF